MSRVYIAGPYTKGDVAVNVHNAIDVANEILKAGHVPYLPHLTHFWHLVTPHPYRDWLDIDLEFLKVCDCILRIPGESNGADGEVEFAKRKGIPIYYKIGDIPND